MTQTRYVELAYEQHDTNWWRIIDTDRQVTVGPHYRSRAELLADLDRFAQEYGATDAGPKLLHPLEDYYNAPSGEGPLAAQWIDKPHRLLYDLCTVLEQAGFCEPTTAEKKPVAIGYWVFGIIARNESLVHWGKAGGTESPFTDKREAELQAEWLIKQAPEDVHYIVTIFDNGQILTEDA